MDTEVLTVACALVGKKWEDVWVYRLARMVEENCSVPYRFVCITDRELPGIECVPFSREIVWTDDHHSRIRDDERLVLNRNKPQGCWAKLDVFQEGFATGPVICLDLDIVITGDLAELIRDDLHMGYDGVKMNGSIYSFTPSEQTKALYPAKIPFSTRPRGEQEWAFETYGDTQYLKNTYSFKMQVANRYGKKPPEDAVVVFFHGRPTPADDKLQEIGWISRTWKGLDRSERVSG